MKKENKKYLIGAATLASIAGGAAAINSFANKTSKALLYRHHKEDDRPSILEAKYHSKNVYIKNHQDVNLRGILLEEANASFTIMVTHPFALEAKDMSLYVPFLKERFPQANILLVDACAHGQSDGYIRGFAIKDIKDVVSWNQYILDTFGKDHKIVMFGKEYGANAILNAASKHVLENVVCVISDGAFTNGYDLLGYRLEQDYKVPRFPTMMLIKRNIQKAIKINLKHDTVDLLKHNDIPTLFVHTKQDDFVPIKMVYPLYNANRGEKELFVLKNERYLFNLVESDEYSKLFINFVKKYV